MYRKTKKSCIHIFCKNTSFCQKKMPPCKKVTQTQEVTQVINSNPIIKEKKPRKSTKKVDISVKTDIQESKEVINQEDKHVKHVQVEVNAGKKIMKNELLKEIETHKHLNEDARTFLISFFKNYKEDFIYEENYNKMINNILGAQENKVKIVHYLNELNKRKEIMNERKENKCRFYKRKASQPILSGNQKQYFIHHSYGHHNPLFKSLATKEAELQANKVIQELEENIDIMELLQNNNDSEQDSDSDEESDKDSDEDKRAHFLSHDEILHFLVKNNDSSESILNSDNNHNNIMNFSQLPTVQEKKAILNCALQIEHKQDTIMRLVEEESVKNASINDILSLYLYKVYLEKEKKEEEKINHHEQNMKSILPNDNKSEYFYSYFVIELNNKVVKLAPYVVKIDKYLNFKNKIFENSGFIKYRNRSTLPENNHFELDKKARLAKNTYGNKYKDKNYHIKSFEENSFENGNDHSDNQDFLISAFLAHFRNQYIHFSKRVDNEKFNVLFNDVSLYESIMNNSILDLIQFEKSENKDYILNHFLKLFDMINDEKIYFNMIDIDYVQQFYDFYLQLYGEKNISSINFLWDYNKKTLADFNKNNVKENNIKNMLCVVNPSVKNMRKEHDFKNSSVGFHNLEKYLFDESEMQYLKDMFPYKLENCLSYSFSNYKNMDSILDLFNISYDSRTKKDNIISMMGDKEGETINNDVQENDLLAIFNISFFEKYGSYLHHHFIYKLQNKYESVFGIRLSVPKKIIPITHNTIRGTANKYKSAYNDGDSLHPKDELSNILDFDINQFDKEQCINNLHFLQIFTFEQFKFYIQSFKRSSIVNDLYNKYLSKDVLDNDDFIQLLYTIVQKIDMDYMKRENNIYLLLLHIFKTFISDEEIQNTKNIKVDHKKDYSPQTQMWLPFQNVEEDKNDNIYNDIKKICIHMKYSFNDGNHGLIQLTHDDSVNNIIKELNNDEHILSAETYKDIYINNGTHYCAYSNNPQNILNKYSYIDDNKDPLSHKPLYDSVSTKELIHKWSPMVIEKNEKREKDGFKKNIFIFYHKTNKVCNVFQYELSQDISNILNKTIYDYFDIFYGNEFVFIEALKEDSIDVEFVNVYNDFNGKYFLNRNEVNEYYKLISKRYKKEVIIQKCEVVLSVEEYCKIIRKYYNIDTNTDHRVRSTELSTKLIDIINQDIENKHQYINEDHFISKFSEIVSELGLSKKRYASGNYYYGISQKVIGNNNNILSLLNVEKIPHGVENYDNDVLNVISKMESELNALKNKFKNKHEKEKETIYSKNNESKLLSNNGSEKILNKEYFLPGQINPNSIVKPFC